MNNDKKPTISEKEIEHLAREINLPVREGFKDRVFEKIREREILREKSREQSERARNERDRNNQSRGMER